MISLSLKYAFDILKVDKVTIGVFENNMPAYYCYKAAGFKDIEARLQCEIFGEMWRILELELTREEYMGGR